MPLKNIPIEPRLVRTPMVFLVIKRNLNKINKMRIIYLFVLLLNNLKLP
jgi:hypothetical protein